MLPKSNWKTRKLLIGKGVRLPKEVPLLRGLPLPRVGRPHPREEGGVALPRGSPYPGMVSLPRGYLYVGDGEGAPLLEEYR